MGSELNYDGIDGIDGVKLQSEGVLQRHHEVLFS